MRSLWLVVQSRQIQLLFAITPKSVDLPNEHGMKWRYK